MNYFKEYERLKIYRKQVPIDSVWTPKVSSHIRYRVERTTVSGITGRLMVGLKSFNGITGEINTCTIGFSTFKTIFRRV